MKIMHLGEYARGGVATYINELLAYQAKVPEITDLYLLLDSRSTAEEFALKSKNIFYYDFSRKKRKALAAIIQIRKYIRKLQPDIVHIHSSYAGFLVRAGYLFSSRRPRIIYCAHGWSFNMEISSFKKRLLVQIEKVLSRQTDLIINISRFEHDSAVANKLPTEKMILIYSGVRESQEAAEPALSLDKDCINLLFVGRFDRQKGLDILLQVFIKYKLENIKLYLLGESILDNCEINIPPEVVNLGWMDQEEMDSYYLSFDAVIMPSRWEGFGLAAIEAMRNGKPVIASNRGSLPEIVAPGINGYIFNLDDETGLAALLQSLDKKVLQEMGQKSYKIYKERFSSQGMNEVIIQGYQGIGKSFK